MLLALSPAVNISYYNLCIRTFADSTRNQESAGLMANLIDIACPQCRNPFKVPSEMAGKRIRCKGCGNTFAVQAAASPPPAKPRPAPPARKDDDEEEDANPYGLSEVVDSSRCPFCAKEMESADAVICLHCGYNIRTRQRVQVKKVIETTSGDRFMWLLPGIICVAVVVVLALLDILYLLWEPQPRSSTEWLGHGGVKTWGIIISLFFMFFAGQFAFRRLILHPVPPEKEKLK